MRRKPLSERAPGATYEIRILGATNTLLRDFYHALLRLPWAVTFAAISVGFLALNALFAVGYWSLGGIAHARPGSFVDAFFFSVQTMGTIGYGAVYPASGAANLLVVGESVAGLIFTALATGLVFAKFSRPTTRMQFSRYAVISPVNGVPTLLFRVGNERGNRIVDAQVRVSMVRSERTAEGHSFYRMLDLRLARERILSLSRSWSVIHPIDDQSPLVKTNPAVLEEQEVELEVMIVGTDDTTMQPVHASHRYFTHDLVWGARHVDILSEVSNGVLQLDLDKFHLIEPTPATLDFPYSYSADPSQA